MIVVMKGTRKRIDGISEKMEGGKENLHWKSNGINRRQKVRLGLKLGQGAVGKVVVVVAVVVGQSLK